MNESPQQLTPKEQYEAHKREKEAMKQRNRTTEKITAVPRRVATYVKVFAVIGGVIALLVWLVMRIPNVPPDSSQNHTEEVPESHILTSPMPPQVQRHMLEHSDGRGAPGVIVQYNCEAYACPPDLVDNLTAIVQEYPERAYLAPNSYDGLIILTREGRRLILDEYDEQAIRDFIGDAQ